MTALHDYVRARSGVPAMLKHPKHRRFKNPTRKTGAWGTLGFAAR